MQISAAITEKDVFGCILDNNAYILTKKVSIPMFSGLKIMIKAFKKWIEDAFNLTNIHDHGVKVERFALPIFVLNTVFWAISDNVGMTNITAFGRF